MVIIQIIYFCTLFVHYFRVSASSGLIPSPTCATCAAVTIKESFFFAFILEYRRKQPRKNSVYLCACLAQPPVRLLFQVSHLVLKVNVKLLPTRQLKSTNHLYA